MVTSFVIVSEQGMYNFVTKRFDSEPAARKAAAKLWCCWVLYRLNDDALAQEITSGGVGFAPTYKGIRKHAETSFRSAARDVDARSGAAAAAEARAAKMAAAAPKAKSSGGPTYTTNGGRPDVSNPVVWD